MALFFFAFLALVVIQFDELMRVVEWDRSVTVPSIVNYGAFQEAHSVWSEVAPVLDGILSEGEWDRGFVVEFDATDRTRPGVASADSSTALYRFNKGMISYVSNHAKLYLLNNASELFVAVDVTDSELDFASSRGDVWRNDSVEVRFDGNFSRGMKEDDRLGFGIIVQGDGEKVVAPGDYAESAARVKDDGSGYVIEVRCDTTDFAPRIGFDVAINDSDDPEEKNRNAQYYWNGTRDSGWIDEREWGIVVLATETVRE